jgi:hypothetical protein
MKTQHYVGIVCLLVLFTACSQQMSKKEMLTWMSNPDNGLVHEKVLNGTSIKLQYKPYQLLAMQEISAMDSLTEKKEKEIIQRYSQQHYFTLSLSQGNKEVLRNLANQQQFSAMVQQLAFNMGQVVVLTTAERDTLSLLDYHYPRLYGMGNSTDILFVFEREEESTKHLTFYLNEFGLRTGNTRFKINTKALKKAVNKMIQKDQY